MAYFKGSYYYDDYDLDNYGDSIEYNNESLPSFGLKDIWLTCGITVLKQIFRQLFYLLSINFIYRTIRQTGW